MSDLKQNADGSLGIEGPYQKDDGPFVIEGLNLTSSTPAAQTVVVLQRPMVLKSIIYREDVAGTGGAATFVVNSAPSGTALSAGTALHSGTFNYVGTAATNQATVPGSALALNGGSNPVGVYLAAGTAIGIVSTGTLTSVVGTLTLALCPA